jgi:hypothetical protein
MNPHANQNNILHSNTFDKRPPNKKKLYHGDMPWAGRNCWSGNRTSSQSSVHNEIEGLHQVVRLGCKMRAKKRLKSMGLSSPPRPRMGRRALTSGEED